MCTSPYLGFCAAAPKFFTGGLPFEGPIRFEHRVRRQSVRSGSPARRRNGSGIGRERAVFFRNNFLPRIEYFVASLDPGGGKNRGERPTG